MESCERMWSTGLSKRTKNSLLRPSITAFAFGADSIMRASCADASDAMAWMPSTARPTIVNRRDIMIALLPALNRSR